MSKVVDPTDYNDEKISEIVLYIEGNTLAVAKILLKLALCYYFSFLVLSINYFYVFESSCFVF